MNKRIVVIGGSAAGPKAAAKAKRLDQHAQVTIIQKSPDLSMASCGYPYYVGGFFEDRNQLLSTPIGVVRDPKFYLKAKGITAKTQTEALSIDRENRIVHCRDLVSGVEFDEPYDKLVLATGASPIIPPVPGHDLQGITTLQSMQDADFLRKIVDDHSVSKAVIVGGGLIGIETCEALQLAGIQITTIEMLPQILTFLDWDLAKLLENHVRMHAANVITDNPVTAFLGENGKLTGVRLKSGTELPCELAVIAVGVRPNSALAGKAGLTVGPRGGITVNEFLQTSDEHIYAVGDCIEVRNRLTGEISPAPYGDLANLEGRVAARNAMEGNHVVFPGTIQTGICKVFDFAAGSTGLSETRARAQGFDAVSCVTSGLDKPHFMGAKLLILKMTADRKTGRLLGLQAVGPGDVSKRIAEAAMAIMGNLTIEDLVNADLPYAPPFSPAVDNLIMAAHVMENKMRGLMKGLSVVEFKERLERKTPMCIIDIRSAEEFEETRLGVGEVLIPLGALRGRLQDLPQDKETEIVLFCKTSLRAYEAATFLEAHGWSNVRVMEGGLAVWPYPREK
ncbi:MAG: FAD-dependent oxidoreductase [Kiritimatiellae bacterium]|nr:FAD-dependent oxidoreductase [Kiritimatiellia bacterium]MDD4737429.1 FAD-dependent oxidoreductase [Kiritimatiellia bacterium]